MGASTIDPSAFIQRPTPELAVAQLRMQSDLGRQQLEQQQRLLGYAATMPMESWSPDIWGQSGMNTKAAQIAAINAFNSRKFEEATNPELARLRQKLPQEIAEDLSGNGWQKQLEQWAKTKGIAQYLGSGLQDSTIGRSALFDASTLEGMALKRANQQAAAQLLAANPEVNVGLDAGSILNAEQQAAASGMQQRTGFRDALLGRTGSAAQGTSDFINTMIASANNAAENYKKEWKDYSNAMLEGAQHAADQSNAMKSAYIGAAGQIGGAALGGYLGRRPPTKGTATV